MGYLKHLHPEPQKEIQAILRSNDIAQQTLALNMDEANPQAIEDLRNYVELCHKTSKQIVLHDMIENRYANRPYGWSMGLGRVPPVMQAAKTQWVEGSW